MVSSALRPQRCTPRTLDEVCAFTHAEIGDSGIGMDAHPTPERTASVTHTASITGISVDSHAVAPGDLFIARPGAASHGARFAAAAVHAGASAVLTDAAGVSLARDCGAPVLIVTDVSAIIGPLCRWFYGTATNGLITFAVTGTNGKTSTVHDLRAVLQSIGVRTGLSSTVSRTVEAQSASSGLTTPEAPEVHALLARAAESGSRAAAIEVSAHGLSRGRVDGIVFDVAGFTNFSRDHLDDYDDLDAYAGAKALLFQPEHCRRAVMTIGDRWAERIRADARVPVVTLARHGTDADWTWRPLDENGSGTVIELSGPHEARVIASVPQVGLHLAANAALAIVMVVEAGFHPDEVELGLVRAGGVGPEVPGRLERVSDAHAPAVYLDYAHTPDAFVQTLRALRRVTRGRVITVFGADGDRDRGKRPDMMRAVQQGSDVTVVTDYSPRTEAPDEIRAQLLAATVADPHHTVLEEADPATAIRLALSLAGADDSVLWAGPGHEDHLDTNDGRIAYDARADARLALIEAGWGVARSDDHSAAQPPQEKDAARSEAAASSATG